MNDKVPSLQEMLSQILIFLVLGDAVHYSIHRMLHEIKFLYKHIHKQHHEFKFVTAFVAHHAHPVDSVLVGVGSFCGPFLFCPHILTFLVWCAILEVNALIMHGGYDFPFTLAAHHNYHHMHNKGNYNYFTGIYDYAFGTDVDYQAWRAKMQEQRVASQKLQ